MLDHRAADLAGRPFPDLLSPGAGRRGRQHLHGPEVPQHAHRRRKGRRAAVGQAGRHRASTRVGSFIRKLRIDEIAADAQRVQGRDELRRSAPGTAILRRAADARKCLTTMCATASSPASPAWAQVRYRYGASVEDAVQKLQYDLYYVKNNSLFLDLLILIDTLKVVLLEQGQQVTRRSRCHGSQRHRGQLRHRGGGFPPADAAAADQLARPSARHGADGGQRHHRAVGRRWSPGRRAPASSCRWQPTCWNWRAMPPGPSSWWRC